MNSDRAIDSNSNQTDYDRRCRTIAGYNVYFDQDGFFWDPEEWNETIAMELALEGGVDNLNEEQWRILRFIREFYFYHGRSPMNKDLKEGIKRPLSELEQIFPGGITNGARRLAGLPNPKTCF